MDTVHVKKKFTRLDLTPGLNRSAVSAAYGRMPGVVILRVPTVDDWPLWRDVRLAALADAPTAFKSTLAGWATGGEQRWRKRLAMPWTHNVVAMLDGLPVGVASGVPADDGAMELRSVWVSPEVRGQGVGDLLISAVLAWAARSAASTMRLAVVPGNDSAVGRYRRHGFVHTQALGELLPDGMTREQVMAKPLS
jgi:ribosomal protein S18 acetylase RimI-like enzyme